MQKLHDIQKQIIGLGKDKQGNGYSYVTGSKVLEFLKPLMNKHGILLKQEILEITNKRQNYIVGFGTPKQREKNEILTTLKMRFTWVDVESGEKDENLFFANGQNDWDKGVGSALTYGERYFLLKFFHISTDEDDIDNPERKAEEQRKIDEYVDSVNNAIQNSKSRDDLTKVWNSIPKDWKNHFKDNVTEKGNELKDLESKEENNNQNQ